MDKNRSNNDNYNPSEDEEFMRIIDSVLKEEEAEKIDIRQKNEFEWIDIDKEVALTKEDEEATFGENQPTVHKSEKEEAHSNDLVKKQDREQIDDQIVDEITNSLSKQVEEEFKMEEKNQPKKKRKVALMIGGLISGILCLLFLTFLFLRYTDAGRKILFRISSGYIALNVNYDDGSEVVDEKEVVPEEKTDPIDEITNPKKEEKPVKEEEKEEKEEVALARHEDYCINILLLGEEALDSLNARGRTDLIIIASINQKEKTIGLTSLMRDMYVQIPGHIDNKLNSAYASGGIPLLYETIELNFNIKLDGYALVGFNDFEKIIDQLSGVTITLTEDEANYLNKTNYISNPIYRNVIAGENQMNGNQALGYCRIRYVSTKENETDDFGRTSRQRIVLNALFEKYKSLGMFDMAIKVNSCLPMITTDLDSKEIERILTMAYDVGLHQIETLRIPADGTYEGANVRDMSVIVPDLSKNTKLMQDFIFGK